MTLNVVRSSQPLVLLPSQSPASCLMRSKARRAGVSGAAGAVAGGSAARRVDVGSARMDVRTSSAVARCITGSVLGQAPPHDVAAGDRDVIGGREPSPALMRAPGSDI